MDRRLSLYLDLLRFFAALVVIAEHGSFLLAPGLGLPTFGREAVVIFFVLSGFVIGHVASRKEMRRVDFGMARASRMYSVVPLALLVTILFDAVGQRFAPEWYGEHIYHPYNIHWRVRDAMRFLTFTNEIWRSHSVVGTNEPYWSLGFEVPYYLLFGLVYFATSRAAKAGWVAAWALLFGPKIAIFLPLWLIGFVAYRVVGSGFKVPVRGAAACAIVSLGLVALLILRFDMLPGTLFLWQGWRQALPLALYTYILAALMALHIVAVNSLPDRFTIFTDAAGKTVRWLAGGSFTLYVMHLPILCCFAALTRAQSKGLLSQISVLTGVVVVCYVLAEAGERRKRQISKIAGLLMASSAVRVV